jgi:hypothetical protein
MSENVVTLPQIDAAPAETETKESKMQSDHNIGSQSEGDHVDPGVAKIRNLCELSAATALRLKSDTLPAFLPSTLGFTT